MKKIIMTSAWNLARNGQSTFGGKVSEYFSESLRITWRVLTMDIKTINITQKYDLAGTEALLREKTTRKMSAGRVETAIKKLEEFISLKNDDIDCYFLFGKTFAQKEELKTAGWKYDGNIRAWWSREDLDNCGFLKISA